MTSLHSALKFLSLPNACPLSIIALDPATGKPIAVNSTFESIFGPLYKFKEWEFGDAATEDEEGGEDPILNRTRFRRAIDVVCDSLLKRGGDGDVAAGANVGVATGNIRNVEMLTLGTNEAGLPIRKYFDWTIGSVKLDSNSEENGDIDGDGNVNGNVNVNAAVMLYGTLINDAESTDRARDAELIDFFQNAPIAMHWLNGDGTILWANQTELNVLGYTPEEYIGQQIMNFCPDEKDLVLEIFKQLGGGKTIKDVPVRFRTKGGKIVHLLIDSNVAYKKDGSFGHTRCFIRDDTARKIKDARVQVLLDENERVS